MGAERFGECLEGTFDYGWNVLLKCCKNETWQGPDVEGRSLGESLGHLVSKVTFGLKADTASCQEWNGEDSPVRLRECQQL